ncbi:PREDICTED: uncharacterized protein LOC105365545, partial [Ceratosolen solmsi marchali]|uniref:Uncharacterized protein LOC105365545 n=1 Tax=Ceratosolen solmsi marchali TaxID=326594 RepID=A0AAJ6YPU9_9HYME
MSRIFVSAALYLGLLISLANGQNCAEDKVRKCITIAEPILKDPHLIFPDNMNDINIVCKTWSDFVDCIRRYIDKCFSKVRKDQFNTAVEPPIASVHQMCSISSYQAEYLRYAGCIKATVIETEHCGGHYSALVTEVSQENVRKANLCCAYHNFRTCVIRKTQLRCDGNQAEGIAARFSRQVLDKAFNFLQDQCLNYIPDTTKCSLIMRNKSGGTLISRLGEGRSVTFEAPNRLNSRKSAHVELHHDKLSDAKDALVTNTAQSSTYETTGQLPNFTNDQYPFMTHNGSPTETNEYVDSRTSIDVQIPFTSAPFDTQAYQTVKYSQVNGEIPEEDTSRKAEPTYHTPIVESSAPIEAATQRPSSYGRAISWTSPPTPSTSEIPDWATSTWLTYNQDLTTEEIYPAAGSFGGNNIDEPNQQGLSRNGGISYTATFFYIFIMCFFAFI